MMQIDYPLKLKNIQMHYSWGNKSELQRLFDIAPENNLPQAELWIGAHPKAPSTAELDDGNLITLDKLIASHTENIMGVKDKEFPFLFKLLSANTPLSIQVHPDKHQAAEGFNRENRKEIPMDASYRNYKDANHKPEMIYAVTPFKAMCGFRPIHEIKEYLNILIDEGIDIPSYLIGSWSPEKELRLLFAWMLSMTEQECTEMIDKVLPLTQKYKRVEAFNTVALLHYYYPFDSAVLSPFWLNIIHLSPGEAMFIDVGCPHAYLNGTGIEVMASSDNVLRGGLTKKHIDVFELHNIVRFDTVNVTKINPIPSLNNDMLIFPAPVDDFCFMLLTIKNNWHRKAGAMHTLFCMEGKITVTGKGVSVLLKKGKSCLLPAACEAEINGHGKLAVTGVGNISDNIDAFKSMQA
ncbi:MAG: mannose-6-phosphate isomerase, class I [Endozoicomonadaceae bacterium]|nr:mannose-6-phosphate isomerase, class I [Endozoicomonadaceae bacterium]